MILWNVHSLVFERICLIRQYFNAFKTYCLIISYFFSTFLRWCTKSRCARMTSQELSFLKTFLEYWSRYPCISSLSINICLYRYARFLRAWHENSKWPIESRRAMWNLDQDWETNVQKEKCVRKWNKSGDSRTSKIVE